LELRKGTMDQLISEASGDGELDWDDLAKSERRVGLMLALIGSTREYQFG